MKQENFGTDGVDVAELGPLRRCHCCTSVGCFVNVNVDDSGGE